MIQIDGVPESLTREQYVTLIRAAGFDTNELRRLEFRLDGIYAQVKATTAAKRNGIVTTGPTPDTDELAVHTVFIPVRDPELENPTQYSDAPAWASETSMVKA